ncbi:hypothetical protein [Sulfurimonas marina]|uniref:hypothetical protein n=1 Tax=Sulfurimonas marina TaxID=2590551 RepID=UPI001D04C378|nr:hypothetical protein [Sulfurimonas marina]
MLPTRIANPKVFNIHPLESNVVKSSRTPLKVAKIEKSYIKKRPKKIAPNNERSTFFV